MNITKRKRIEEALYRYPHRQKEIERIRAEIMAPWQEADQNVGGGRSSETGDPTGSVVARLVEDPRIAEIEHMAGIIEQAYSEQSQDVQRMVRLKYWSGCRRSVTSLCDELHIGERTFYRWRDDFVKAVAESWQF
jgi:RinA family phage transcriptional activator